MSNAIVKKLTRLVVATRYAERKHATLMLSVKDGFRLALYIYHAMLQIPGTVEMKYNMSPEQFIDEQQYRRFNTFRGMALEWDAKVAASCVFVADHVDVEA